MKSEWGGRGRHTFHAIMRWGERVCEECGVEVVKYWW